MALFFALLAFLVVQPVMGAQIQVLPVARTPESNTVILAVAKPQSGQVVKKNPVWVQFRLDGYALGAGGSQFERAQELVSSKMGQTVHVIIDDRPYFPINEPSLDPFDESGYFYNMSYQFELPFSLQEGMHVMRIFPARSFGESLKGDKVFRVVPFYVGKREKRPPFDLSKPYLTYNEPSNRFHFVEDKPILLDFYVSNCELTVDGYKVQLTIDGKVERLLASWQPYYIYGLKRGKHTIALQLLNGRGEKVSGSSNYVERTIQVH